MSSVSSSDKRVENFSFTPEQRAALIKNRFMLSSDKVYLFMCDVDGTLFKNIIPSNDSKQVTSYVLNSDSPTPDQSLMFLYEQLALDTSRPIAISLMTFDNRRSPAILNEGPCNVSCGVVHVRLDTLKSFTSKHGEKYSIRGGVTDMSMHAYIVKSVPASF